MESMIGVYISVVRLRGARYTTIAKKSTHLSTLLRSQFSEVVLNQVMIDLSKRICLNHLA